MVNVIISGTFDRLHAGHKSLLHRGIVIAKQNNNHLLVEITPWSYVCKFKKYSHIVKSEFDRLNDVEKYLSLHLNSDKYSVVISNDEYGSAMYSQNLDAMIIGTDTMGWAQMINYYRMQCGLSELTISMTPDYFIDGNRISSTHLREQEINGVKVV
jgi:phosphopantetheine adenylyltransferase